MSRGEDRSYKNVGVLRTNASENIAPDTRGTLSQYHFEFMLITSDYKNRGFSYPVAVQVGNKLVTAYSENKQNIWVSVVDVEDLPHR